MLYTVFWHIQLTKMKTVVPTPIQQNHIDITQTLTSSPQFNTIIFQNVPSPFHFIHWKITVSGKLNSRRSHMSVNIPQIKRRKKPSLDHKLFSWKHDSMKIWHTTMESGYFFAHFFKQKSDMLTNICKSVQYQISWNFVLKLPSFFYVYRQTHTLM